jgi:hypothetical protein
MKCFAAKSFIVFFEVSLEILFSNSELIILHTNAKKCGILVMPAADAALGPVIQNFLQL